MPDPLTANEEIQRATIRHQIRLERVKTGQATRVKNFLEQKLYPDLLAKVEARVARIKARGFDSGPTVTKRINDLLEATDSLINDGFNQIYRDVRDGLFDISAAEGSWQAGTLRQVFPAQFQILLPARETLRSIVTSRPFQGRLLRKWYGGLSATMKQRTRAAVSIGIAEGEGTAVIARRIRDANGLTTKQAQAIVKTAVNHTTAQARQESYKTNDDLIKGWIFSATLDGRTTFECSGLDGTQWPLNEGPLPPRHIGCRSADIPWLKSFRELGFDVGDLPAGTRIKFDGKVPDTFKFDDFLRNESASFQLEYLGRTRYQLYKTGKITVDRFSDKLGNTLTIDKLRTLESDVFAAASGLNRSGVLAVSS